jgi:hypothetical protein
MRRYLKDPNTSGCAKPWLVFIPRLQFIVFFGLPWIGSTLLNVGDVERWEAAGVQTASVIHNRSSAHTVIFAAILANIPPCAPPASQSGLLIYGSDLIRFFLARYKMRSIG